MTGRDEVSQILIPAGQRTTPLQVALFDPLATVPYYTAYLSRALLAEGVDVQICSISYYLDPQCFSSRDLRTDPGLMDTVGRHALPPAPRRILKTLEMGVNLAALRLRYRQKAPAVLHVQFLPLLRSAVPLDLAFMHYCQRRGSKIVLTVHDLLPHDTADRHRDVYLRLYRSVDALICHSTHIRVRLIEEFGIPEDRVFVIPHGPFFYDLPRTHETQGLRERLRIEPRRKIVLWQGILFPYKGLDVLLEAWQQVEREHETAQLVVLGTGSPEILGSVQTQVADLGLQHVSLDLRFCSTEELVDAYRSAEVVVYPYRAITTSGALATGLALGKAIVASDLPVFRELLTDGENALLTPPQDAAALATAISTLLHEDELRARLSRAVEGMQFGDASWRSIAKDTYQVYEQVLLR